MTVSQIVALASNGLGLILTLGMIQWLALRRVWRTAAGHALMQFLTGVAVRQGLLLLVVISVLARYPALIVQGTANLAVISSLVVALTGLALLLHAGSAMKAAWQVASRSGAVGLAVLLPGLWYFDLLQFPESLASTGVHYRYTVFGSVIAGLCAAYLVLTLGVAWRFWRQIDNAAFVASVIGIALIQLAELVIAPARGLGVSGIVGGVASLILVYTFMDQWEADPHTSQTTWLTVARRVADILTANQALPDSLIQLAEQVRYLVRCDSVIVLVSTGTDYLEVAAAIHDDTETSSTLESIVGRRVRHGEGLAGRVLQTLYSMRVDSYRTWNGRSAAFDDLPIYASMSVPLVFRGQLVGVINASEIAPGRTFTARDQRLLELLAPHMATLIVTHQLSDGQQTPTALLVFDAAGHVRQANPLARRYLHEWFGDSLPSALEFAAKAEDSRLTEAIGQWMRDSASMHTLETSYPSLGRLRFELEAVPADPAGEAGLLVLFRPISGLSPERELTYY